jgi:uncharacterized protein
VEKPLVTLGILFGEAELLTLEAELHVADVARLDVEIVLLGTGQGQPMLDAHLVMDSVKVAVQRVEVIKFLSRGATEETTEEWCCPVKQRKYL